MFSVTLYQVFAVNLEIHLVYHGSCLASLPQKEPYDQQSHLEEQAMLCINEGGREKGGERERKREREREREQTES